MSTPAESTTHAASGRLERGRLEPWVSFLRAHAAITRELSAQLQRGHGLTLNDYEVLLHLARADGGRMRRVDLAESVILTASGITRLLDGLERSGFVCKETCASDRRVSYAKLTAEGAAKLREAGRHSPRRCRRALPRPLLGLGAGHSGRAARTPADDRGGLPRRGRRLRRLNREPFEVASRGAGTRPPAASSASNFPRCTMRPCSSTTISSARRTVARRWAMMIDVRPWSSGRGRARSAPPPAGRCSRSPRRRSGSAGRRAVRARSRSAAARLPTARRPLRAPHAAAPSRSGARSARRRRRAATSATISSVASGRAKRTLSAMRSGEQERILQHDPELAPVRA